LPFGMGWAYPYWPGGGYWGNCRWFPWLPRWWWTGMYGPLSPWGYSGTTYPLGYTSSWPFAPATASREDEKSFLEERMKWLEAELSQVKKRLEELDKED